MLSELERSSEQLEQLWSSRHEVRERVTVEDREECALSAGQHSLEPARRFNWAGVSLRVEALHEIPPRLSEPEETADVDLRGWLCQPQSAVAPADAHHKTFAHQQLHCLDDDVRRNPVCAAHLAHGDQPVGVQPQIEQ